MTVDKRKYVTVDPATGLESLQTAIQSSAGTTDANKIPATETATGWLANNLQPFPQVKTTVATGETVTVGTGYQLIVFDALTVDGTLNLNGDLIELGGITPPAEPLYQIVYGTGAGLDSSANYTFNPDTGALQLATLTATPGQSSLIAASNNGVGLGAQMIISAGAGGTTSGDGGPLFLQGGSVTNGNAGAIFMIAPAGGGAAGSGGDVSINAGDSSGSANPGNFSAFAGNADTDGTGGSSSMVAGDGGTASVTTNDSQGGQVSIFAGSATSGNNKGGDVNITAGTATGTEANGIVTLTGGNGDTFQVGASIILTTVGATSITLATNSTNHLEITSTGEWLIDGASGTSGQAITSGGPGVPPSWASSFPSLYAENPVAFTAPSATGSNAVAIGSGAINQAADAIVWGTGASAGQFGTAPSSVVLGPSAQSNDDSGIAIGSSAGTNQLGAIAIGVGASSNGIEAIALGSGANAQATNIIAIGKLANSTGTGGTNCIAIGTSTVISSTSTIAIGDAASAVATSSIAIGDSASTPSGGTGPIAIGLNATTAAGISIGGDSNAAGSGSIAFGTSATTAASASQGIAIGNTASVAASSTDAIAIGTTATASGADAIAIGTTATADVTGGIAIGFSTSLGGGLRAIAIGYDASAPGQESVALGDVAHSDASGSIAIGNAATVQESANNAIAIGNTADANDTAASKAIAIGFSSSAKGLATIAIGDTAVVPNDSDSSLAIGDGATVSATTTNAIAIGAGATIAGGYGLAIGAGASVTSTGLIAIGPSAISSQLGSIAIGGANVNKHYAAAINASAATPTIALPGSLEFNTYLGDSGMTKTVRHIEVMLAENTTNNTPIALKVANNATGPVIPSSSVWLFEVDVVARRSDTFQVAAYTFTGGVLKNDAGTTTLAASPTKTVLFEDNANYDVNVTADDTNDSLAVTVTGDTGNTVDWLARVRILPLSST